VEKTDDDGRGNDGLWKEWENDETVFPLFPQTLEIARDSHISTATTTTTKMNEYLSNPSNQNRQNEAQYHYPGGPNKMVKVGHAGIANSAAFLGQTLLEEGSDVRCNRCGHARCSMANCSAQSAMSRISSGTASRYQYVCSTLLWPR